MPFSTEWVSKLVVLLASTQPQLEELGISPTLTVLENQKSNLSISSSKVSHLSEFFGQSADCDISGVAQIIRWEQDLEAGKNIDAEVAAVALPKTVTIEVPFSSTRGMKLD